MSASIHPSLLLHSRQSAKSSKMSITQTFYLAHKARGKLSSEAAKSDHDLRLLVGHANLLDSLMLHLQAAEREQDAWFNAMVRGNSMEEDDEEDVMETIQEEEDDFGSLAKDYPESDTSDEEETDEDYDYESDYLGVTPRPLAFDYSKTVIGVDEVEVDDEFEEEEDGFYALRRTSSHAPPSPPELMEDEDSDSESNPPSPPQPTLAEPIFYDTTRKQISTKSFYDSTSPADLIDPHYYQPPNLIPAF